MSEQMTLQLQLELEEEEELGLALEEEEQLSLELEENPSSGTSDYNELLNKPKLNGKELIGNTNEADPTVPEWAKAETKPTYTASEVNAVAQEDAITISEIDEIFRGIFNV